MAIDAFQGRVRADQREAVLVRFDFLSVHIPAFDGVALLAIGAELAPMDIGVAIRAFHTDTFEVQADVALRAGNAGVHSPQRVACLIVIEFRDAADWLPVRGGMAVFARDVDGAVRIACVPGLLRSRSSPCHRQKKQRRENEREGDRFPHGCFGGTDASASYIGWMPGLLDATFWWDAKQLSSGAGLVQYYFAGLPFGTQACADQLWQLAQSFGARL